MKEWYLENTPPNITSGYESDAISEYAESNFTDVLETTFSDTVLLYNSSLTESKEVKCVIQGNIADTQLKSMERTILFPIGTVQAGMYIYFENSYWIVDGRPGNNKSYEKVTAKLCQYNLTWQLANGDIIKRWVSLASASKYDTGESGGSVIILSSNNYTMLIGYDEDALELEGMRVFIDKKATLPTKVFKLTRNDDVLYDFGEHGSVLSFICDKGELNTTEDNQELRICNYHSPTTSPSPPDSPETDETAVLSASITGKPELKLELSRTYTVTFTDKNGLEVTDAEFAWNVVADFDVEQVVEGNTVELYVEDDSLIGESFLLQVTVSNKVVAEIEVTVVDF